MNQKKVQISSDRNIIVIEKNNKFEDIKYKKDNTSNNISKNDSTNNINSSLINTSNNNAPIIVKRINFKKKDFVSKQRVNYVSGKAVRNMIVTPLDLITYNLCKLIFYIQ